MHRTRRKRRDFKRVFRPLKGQTVQVRPAWQIFESLDSNMTLDGLPFMPEMLKYCGGRLTVYRRADRTCVEGHGLCAMHDTVFLSGSHCDGAAHDGCQKDCLIFWKEDWLSPIDELDTTTATVDAPANEALFDNLLAKTRDGTRYNCQSTHLHNATLPLARYDLSKYFREITDGELSISRFIGIVVRALLNRIRRVLGMDPIDAIRGRSVPHSKGDLNLRSGELVEVRSVLEIRNTVGPSGRNRGLLFEPDMTAYVGQKFEVDIPVSKIISEETGQMINITNTVTLRGVRCTGLCAKNCPRAQAHLWREAWLKRVIEAGKTSNSISPP